MEVVRNPSGSYSEDRWCKSSCCHHNTKKLCDKYKGRFIINWIGYAYRTIDQKDIKLVKGDFQTIKEVEKGIREKLEKSPMSLRVMLKELI